MSVNNCNGVFTYMYGGIVVEWALLFAKLYRFGVILNKYLQLISRKGCAHTRLVT